MLLQSDSLMEVLQEGWWSCFCSGGGKSERVKGNIFTSKGASFAAISVAGGGGGGGSGGTGFLIHRNLLLTTHANLPTVAAAEAAEIRLCHGRLPARLVPQRFFITSSILDLTIVGLDIVDAESSSQVHQPHSLKTYCKTSLQLGTMVYLLGRTDKEELTVGEGKVVIATDNLIKLSTDWITWCPGSAGFDTQGNLAFMICDPMKLASSPTARSSASSSDSSKSWKKDIPMQFGIPMPIIYDWLHQHWEGSLDEVSKPRLPLVRLLSSGHSENSAASLTLRRVFKATEENDDDSSSSHKVYRAKFHPGSSSSANGRLCYDENPLVDLRSTHEHGIITPEIFGSPEKTEHKLVQLPDADIPLKAPKSMFLPLPLRQMLSDETDLECRRPRNQSSETGILSVSQELTRAYLKSTRHRIPPIGTWGNDLCSDVQSSASPLGMLDDGFNSREETMYSAETMESRNIPSPRESRLQSVARSQSCVNYSRSSKQSAAERRAALQKQNTIIPVRKPNAPAAALPQRSHDYCSPTVSSSMKKRNSSEQPPVRPRRNAVQVSPRWMF